MDKIGANLAIRKNSPSYNLYSRSFDLRKINEVQNIITSKITFLENIPPYQQDEMMSSQYYIYSFQSSNVF